VDHSERASQSRRLWGEAEPLSLYGSVYPSREIVPGLLDPIADPAFSNVPEWWPHDPNIVKRHREAILSLVGATMPSFGRRAGAGVVMIGGGKYWPGNVVSVRMLRDTGSNLPVQIWHRGDAEPVQAQDLADIAGVQIRDLTSIEPAPRILRGWDAKTTAILASNWERVFFLDADAYCLADPAALLDRLSVEEPFLYWEDLPYSNNVRWEVWGCSANTVPPVQGGQLAIQLCHFWRELVLAHWLNQHSDFVYAHQYGDQDSWRVALNLTGGAFKSLGNAQWAQMAFICDLNGQPFVIHRCQSKMFYPEDQTANSTANRKLDRLPGEARAWAHYEHLLSRRDAPEVFRRIYASALWGPGESSGGGSTLEYARPYLEIVNGLIEAANWRRVVDLGCGDGYITGQLRAPEVIGVDCYPNHISRLRKEYPDRSWLHLDLDLDREELPGGDVALLKDVLMHWPNLMIQDWLTWARKSRKWRWIICTQDHHAQTDGQDCRLGGYRPLDLNNEPLRNLNLVRFCEYLGKTVLLLKADSDR
jgi:SAM-dependent methyltransferase